MKIAAKFFALSLAVAVLPAMPAHASCHVPNLIRCIDSACIAGLAGDPTVRCGLCGSSAVTLTRRPSANQRASATTLEIRNAPTDPAARYSWAATECLQRIAGCTSDDVTDNYNPLIEQSCRAANVSMSFAAAATAPVRKSSAECRRDMIECMNRRCGAGFANCQQDSDLDRNFSTCLIDTSCGSDPEVSDIRNTIRRSRDDFERNRIAAAESAATQRRRARESAAQSAREDCRTGAAKESCVRSMCANFANRCEDNRDETAMANNLCRFVDIACGKIRQ